MKIRDKMILPQPSRYSEDLDFVRSSAGGIGDIMKALTELGKQTGFTVKTKRRRRLSFGPYTSVQRGEIYTISGS
jgi:predicted nucleotidyltransferase component of viral defense system